MTRLPVIKSLFLLVVAFFSCTYFLTKSPVPTGYADSDEFITVGALGGVAHPPGYPLIVSSIFVLTKLGIDPFAAGQFLAIAFQSLAMGFLFLALTEFVSTSFGRSKQDVHVLLAALSGVGVLGFSAIYWLYGTTIEVTSLTVLLSCATLFFALRWHRQVKEEKAGFLSFYLTWFFAGLALFHMQTVIFLLPALLLLLIFTLRQKSVDLSLKTWLKAVFLFLIPLVISAVLLLVLNQNQAEVSWYFPQSVSGLVRHFLRQDYAGYFVEEGRARDAYWAGFGQKFFTAQPLYFNALSEHFTLPVLLISTAAFIWLILRKYRLPVVLAIFTFFILSGPLFTGYMGFPEYQSQDLEYFSQVGVHHRQLVLSELAMIFFFTSGAYLFNSWVKKYLPEMFLPLFSVVLVSFVAWSNWPIGNQTQNKYIHAYAKTMLDQAEVDSVIICASDIACYSLLYVTKIENYRADVTVLTKNNRYRHYFLSKNQTFFPFSYDDSPFFYANLIAYNASKRTVYLTNPDSFYIDYIGLSGNPFYLIPRGYLYEVSKVLPNNLSFAPNLGYSNTVIQAAFSEKDYFMRGFKDYLASMHNLNGSLLINYGLLPAAKDQLERAISLKPDLEESIAFLRTIPLREPLVLFNSEKSLSAEEYREQANKAIEQKQLEKAYEYLRKASYLEPENSQIRLSLAHLYQQGGYPKEAVQELRHGLLFDPDNTEIKAMLSKTPSN